MNRALAVTRMNLTDRLSMFLSPLSVLFAATGISLAIFALLPDDGRTSGSGASVYAVVLAAGVLLVSQSMRLALGMGASRRSFVLGTWMTGVLQAVVFGTLLTLLNRLEVVTSGWGLHGHIFAWPWLAGHSPAATWLLLTIGFVATFLLGAWASAIWVRWHAVGMWTGLVLSFAVFGGVAILLTWEHAWVGLGSWFAGLTPVTASGWLVLLCLLLAGAGHLTLRRAEL